MKLSKWLFAFTFLLSVSFLGCAPKDSDIQTDINNKLKDKPELATVTATVEDGMATLSGEVKSEADKNSAEALAKETSGVDSVNNNITIYMPADAVTPSATLTADHQMMESINKILKDEPNVKATVSGGVITLTGSIKRNNEQKLIDTLQTLAPKNIDNQLTEQ